jgi:hypothetical protein
MWQAKAKAFAKTQANEVCLNTINNIVVVNHLYSFHFLHKFAQQYMDQEFAQF